MASNGVARVKSLTFLDEIAVGDEEIDQWVALSGGSQDFVKELLELGEDSLEFSAAEDQLRNLENKLNEAESRVAQLKTELVAKNKDISRLEDALDNLKKELLEERAKARDEAEDMAQEMAELRYQLTEILEEERQLRARTEQVSVHRVEELESQVKQARQEAVAALSRLRETECQAEKEIQKLRGSFEEAQQQLQEAKLQVDELNQRERENFSTYSKETLSLKEELLQVRSKLEEKERECERLQQALQAAEVEDKEICVDCDRIQDHDQDRASAADENEKEIMIVQDDPEQCVFEDKDSTVEVPAADSEGKIQKQDDSNEDSSVENDDLNVVRINRFEEKIREIEASEMQLQLERDDLSLEVSKLKTQLDQTRTDLQSSIDRHSEELLKNNEEKSSLQAEAADSKATLSSQILELQELIDQRSRQYESTLKELTACRTELEAETDSSQQLAARVRVLESELQSERSLRSESASKLMLLNQSLDETMQKVSTLEAELGVSKIDNENIRKALESTESNLLESTKQKHELEQNLQQLRVVTQNQEQNLIRIQQELLSHKSGNAQLAHKVGELNSEVLILQQQLITCQTQASEMAMRNVILEDTVASKKRKIKEGEETIIQQAEKIGKQEERYFSLQAKLSALQNDFSVLESKLRETRKREQEVRAQVQRIGLELGMAKQEVVSSEVRLQKVVKQVKEQHEEQINKHRQTEWFLNKTIEHLERSDSEKERVQKIRGG